MYRFASYKRADAHFDLFFWCVKINRTVGLVSTARAPDNIITGIPAMTDGAYLHGFELLNITEFIGL